MRRLWIIAGLAVVLSLLVLGQQPVAAHGYILRSIPQDRAVLSHAPAWIRIWFSEALEPNFSTLSVTNEKGEAIPLTENGLVSGHPDQLAAHLPLNLPDGAYTATLHIAFASDGHVITDTLAFWVGQQSGSIAAASAPPSANLWEVGWRSLMLISFDTLFGILLLYQAVLLPAWHNRRYRIGQLPPRLMRRLTWVIWVSLIAAIVSSILALLQQSTLLFSASLSTVLQNGLWSVVLRSTQFGEDIAIRFSLLVLVLILHAVSQYYAERFPFLLIPAWAVNLLLVGAALGTISISSHAAGSTLWPLVAIAVDYVHLLMNALWIGGLIGLALLLPVALKPLSDVERRTALLPVMRRFSRLGVLAVALLITTGIFSALLYIRQPADLPDTDYGRTLIAKVVLILPLLLIALYHHGLVAEGPLANFARRINLAARFEQLIASLRMESILGIVVVLIVALLTASPPPIPADARAGAAPPSQSQTVGDMQVTLSVDPGATGANSYTVTVSRHNNPLTGAHIYLRFTYPTLDKRSPLLALDDAGDGSYIGSGAELDRAGDWDAQIDVVPNGSAYDPTLRAAFHWLLPDIAPNTIIRQPTVLNWLSLASIFVVIGIFLKPQGQRFAYAISRQPESLAVLIVVSIIAVILILISTILVNNAAQQTDALRNHPPAEVNIVFPDAASVTAGKSIYDAQCAVCHGPSGAGDGSQPVQIDLRDRLPNRRDEDLFRLMAQGDPHSSVSSLSEAERWNVINYLRSPVFAK